MYSYIRMYSTVLTERGATPPTTATDHSASPRAQADRHTRYTNVLTWGAQPSTSTASTSVSSVGGRPYYVGVPRAAPATDTLVSVPRAPPTRRSGALLPLGRAECYVRIAVIIIRSVAGVLDEPLLRVRWRDERHTVAPLLERVVLLGVVGHGPGSSPASAGFRVTPAYIHSAGGMTPSRAEGNVSSATSPSTRTQAWRVGFSP